MISSLFKILGVFSLALLLTSCSETDDTDTGSSSTDFTTVKYDYQWPSSSSLDGYKIRMTDTTFVKKDRPFLEFLQESTSHAFVYDFMQYPGSSQYELYGYEQDNPKYRSNFYTASIGTLEDNTEIMTFTTYYYYKDVSGVDIEGSDSYELYPTSATGGTYMCWGEYPIGTHLYDAKTGVYEFVVDPTIH